MNARKNAFAARSFISACAIGTVIVGVGMQVAAAAEPTGHQLEISYADLNLSTPGGASALYQRIHGAAERVCGPVTRSIADMSRYKSCVAKATSDAVAKVGREELTAVYESHAGKARTVQLASSFAR